MNKNIPFIRFNHLWKNKKILTNIYGESIILKNEEFDKYIKNEIPEDNSLYKELEKKLFLKTSWYEEKAVLEYKKRYWINFIWPTLHIIVLTKNCNHQCKYCHSSAVYWEVEKDKTMCKKTAKKVIDIIFQSPSKDLTIEFQWWEPLLKIDLIDYIVKYSEEKNKIFKKNINFALVSNLSLINNELLEKLFSYNNFSISTSLDWDKKTHDFNRLLLVNKEQISSFDLLKEKIELIREWEKKKWKKILFWAMWVVTKKSLNNYKEIVDTYVELWFNNIFLKKVNWLWFATNNQKIIWYSDEELKEFYLNYFNYLVELHEKWVKIKDGFLSIILWKILKPEKMNFMDLRSPCGAWIWQITYDYTWSIYSCDEWRMIPEDVFKIWDTNDWLEELVQNEVIWAMMDASIVEGLPCDICAYASFCWVCPIESYKSRGNIYTNQKFDSHCKFFTFIFDWVFEVLYEKNKKEYDFLAYHLKNLS